MFFHGSMKRFPRAERGGVEARRAEVCLEDPRRAFRYGMNYYSVMPLPDCSERERPVHVKR